MKKFTLILSLLVAMVSTAVASVITPSKTLPTEGTPEALFTMVNGNAVYANGVTAPTETEANYGQFAFYAVPDVPNAYYIYSATASQWLTYDMAASYDNGRNVVKMSAEKGNYFEVTSCDSYSDYYQIRLFANDGNVDEDRYLNWNGGVGSDGFNAYDDDNSKLGLWQDSGSDDAGSRYLFTNVSTIFDEIDAEPLTSDYYYQIVNRQTGAALACIDVTSAGVAVENMSDATQLWALVDAGDGTYKLLNKSNNLCLSYTAAGGTCWTLDAAGSPFYIGVQQKATTEPTPAYYYISGVAIADASVASRTCAHDANWGAGYLYKQVVTWDNTAEASMWKFVQSDIEVVLGATAIEKAEVINEKTAIYDLSGRIVENPTKGIYIVNGKQVFVK